MANARAVLVSVISMISSPNDESPANIEAAVRAPVDLRKNLAVATLLSRPRVLAGGVGCAQKQRREDPEGYRKKVQRIVRRSQEG